MIKLKGIINKIGICCVLILILTLTILCSTGFIGLWTKGMAYVADNTKIFIEKGHVIEGEYSISINLNDLKSNIGKELYNDGSHKILVSWVTKSGASNNIVYQIGFRSYGQYSLKDATLVSGVHHATIGDAAFTSLMSSEMTTAYNNKIYKSRVAGIGGLNYMNGDEFSFYIFPSDSYITGELPLNENGIVKLTLSKLYLNIWSKK